MDFNGSLKVIMDPFESLLVFIASYTSLCVLWVLIGPYGSLCVLMCVLIGPNAFF